ncbi:hypothetical protein BKA82DRAFT_28630 [Pisolithus tinctorius]|uniref:Uncharacterized protein n=1 Tax=Pisolithus tinctorius Marx 270 TaxID=870435 RepID=A0A0C3JVY5_PISTI|nr:hypothetical protein BKA82DRAFT_28630 [Pisolithus tinctorius]KIO01612.1 hypothetical protein M404DRAFT_28630 [Pisolithus tinctorius Marx 270]
MPPSLCRAEARRGLAQQARENQDPNHYVGWCKHPHMQANSERLTGDDEMAGCSLSQPVFPDQGDLDIPQIDTDPLTDPIDNDQLRHPDDCDDFFPPLPSPPQSPSVEQDTCPPPAPCNPMDPEEQDAPPPPPPSNSVDEALPQHCQIIYQ